MFDREAIEALAESQAIDAANNAIGYAFGVADGEKARGLVALPSDHQVHDLEKHLPLRRRARGSMTTPDLAGFASYVTTHGERGCSVFVNTKLMRAIAVLNLGMPDAPGHADNIAVFDPPQLAAWRAMLKIAGDAVSQKALAEWLEDWASHINCFDEHGNHVAAAHAVAAVRKITIENLRRLESTQGQLSEQRSAFESVGAKDTDKLPVTVSFTAEPHVGFDTRTVSMRLSILTGGDKPALRLRIVNAEQMEQDIADELARRVTDAIGDATPVYLGGYAADR